MKRAGEGLPLAGDARAVVIHHYDPVWPELFGRERARILRALAPRPVAVEHVGSTAVPGLAAKPVIDLMVGVASLERDAPACVAALVEDGWAYRPEHEAALPERRYLVRPGSAGDACHLHLVALGSPFWEEHLLFRDYMRARPRAALAYQQLKHVLSVHAADRAAYTEGKAGFIGTIVALARTERAAGRL